MKSSVSRRVTALIRFLRGKIKRYLKLIAQPRRRRGGIRHGGAGIDKLKSLMAHNSSDNLGRAVGGIDGGEKNNVGTIKRSFLRWWSGGLMSSKFLIDIRVST